MKTLQERLRKSSGDFRLLCLEAATALDTLEAEVARLRQVIAQAGDNIELQEAEQRGFLRGQATPLSAQKEDVVATAWKLFGENINDQKPCACCAGKGYAHGVGKDGIDPDWCKVCGGNGFDSKFPDDKDAFADALKRSGLLSDRERGLEK